MHRGLAAAIACAGLVVAWSAREATACLWDSDTLRTEAKGLPGMAEIITGRFAREPALYYEMRLARVTRVLATDPDNLDAYDDAAVACDRLGRGDEAVEWLEKKQTALDRLTGAGRDAGEHLYRYHANLGTVLAHRWFRSGADRDRMEDLKAGRQHIAEAIRINPQAHFGREKYQLMALEWVIAAPPPQDGDSFPGCIFDVNPAFHGYSHDLRTEAAEGLAGLVALGNAWESFDVFYALGLTLEGRHDAAMAVLARLRCEELIDAGKGSIRPGAAHGAELKKLIAYLGEPSLSADEIPAYFARARRSAEEWHAHRTAFMLARLNAGRHPDTDPSFWDGYREQPAPPLPDGVLGLAGHDLQIAQAAGIGALALGSIVAGVVLVRKRRRTRRGAPA